MKISNSWSEPQNEAWRSHRINWHRFGNQRTHFTKKGLNWTDEESWGQKCKTRERSYPTRMHGTNFVHVQGRISVQTYIDNPMHMHRSILEQTDQPSMTRTLMETNFGAFLDLVLPPTNTRQGKTFKRFLSITFHTILYHIIKSFKNECKLIISWKGEQINHVDWIKKHQNLEYSNLEN